MKLSQLKTNPNNPRTISDHKLDKLIASIKDFDAMLEARPIIVNKDYVVLGGNMRLLALQKLGYDEIPDEWIKVVEFDSEQELEFIIKDNVGFGDWDWEVLNEEWDIDKLGDWGLEVNNWALGLDVNEMTEQELDMEEEFDPIGISTGVRRVQVIFDNDYEAEKWFENNHPNLKIEKIGASWRINFSTIIT